MHQLDMSSLAPERAGCNQKIYAVEQPPSYEGVGTDTPDAAARRDHHGATAANGSEANVEG
jgi:hypothetical protein